MACVGGGSSVLEGCWQQAAFQKAGVFGQGRLKCRCYIIHTTLGLLEKSNFRYKGELWGTRSCYAGGKVGFGFSTACHKGREGNSCVPGGVPGISHQQPLVVVSQVQLANVDSGSLILEPLTHKVAEVLPVIQLPLKKQCKYCSVFAVFFFFK